MQVVHLRVKNILELIQKEIYNSLAFDYICFRLQTFFKVSLRNSCHHVGCTLFWQIIDIFGSSCLML